MGKELTLLTSRFTPFGQRVQIALAAKGVEADVVIVDLANKPKELLDANPVHKKVPALVHKGKPVAESLVILEYLEDAFPEVPLMPKDAHEKAKVRFWSDYIAQGFSAMGASLQLKPGSPEKEAAVQANAALFRNINGAMLEYSADGPYFTGDKLGYLDAVLGPFALSIKLISKLAGNLPGPDEIPRFYKWVEAMKANPIVSSNLPTEDESLAYLSAMIERRAAAAAAAAQ